MKKLTLLLVCLLSGCTTGQFQTETQQAEQILPVTSVSQLPEHIRVKPKAVMPKGTKDGEISNTAKNGRSYKFWVKNGLVDKEMNVYYPNGQLHSRTPFVNGLAQGWSEGYTEQGQLRTRILYKNSEVIRYQVYDRQGNIIQDIQ